MKRAIEEMAAAKAEEVVLEAEVTNKGALALYRNLGFLRDKRLLRYTTLGRMQKVDQYELADGLRNIRLLANDAPADVFCCTDAMRPDASLHHRFAVTTVL